MTTTTENYGGTGDTANTNTVYTYDGMSQVKTMADHNGNTTTYAYDDAGRLTDIIYPDAAPNTLHYAYGNGPKPTGRTDQKGVQTTFTWDNMYRLTQRTYPTRQETFSYNRSGRLLTANNGFVNETFDYDDLGRIESLSQAFTGGGTYTTTAVYAIGTPESTVTLTYPATRQVAYTFDHRFRMTGVSGGTGVGATWTFDLADQAATSSFANGVSSVFDMDVNGRLTHLWRFKDGEPPVTLLEYDYGYDAIGQRSYTRDLVATDRSELYGHDARNRLRNSERGTLNAQGTTITTPLVDPALPSQQQWTLDARGNWSSFSTTLNGQPAVEQTRTPNNVNEIQTLDPDGSGGQPAVTLANDSNGNLAENPWAFNAGDTGTPTGQKYEYDEENRLVRVRRLSDSAILLEINYDAVGRRVESREYLDASGQPLSPPRVTRHVVLGPMTIEEYTITGSGTATLAREFLWADRFPSPVAMIDHTTGSQPGVLHYLRDILGNVAALANSDGDVVERYRYDAYGTTHIYNASGTPLRTSAYGNPFAFTGQRYDAVVGLYHYWFRTYSPSLGRWLQRDPMGYADGANLYEYARSDCLVLLDPLGLWCWKDFFKTVGGDAAIGAAGGATAGAFAGGTSLPLIGTVPGGVAGGILGGLAGGTEGAVRYTGGQVWGYFFPPPATAPALPAPAGPTIIINGPVINGPITIINIYGTPPTSMPAPPSVPQYTIIVSPPPGAPAAPPPPTQPALPAPPPRPLLPPPSGLPNSSP